jgi:hypothetical protein
MSKVDTKSADADAVSCKAQSIHEGMTLELAPQAGAGSELSSSIEFTAAREKAILRKMDRRLIPMLAVLYLLSFLDRGNIGNAKIQGLTTDLGLSSKQYNLCRKSAFLNRTIHAWIVRLLTNVTYFPSYHILHQLCRV